MRCAWVTGGRGKCAGVGSRGNGAASGRALFPFLESPATRARDGLGFTYLLASLLHVMSHTNVVRSSGCLPELYYIAELVVSKIIYHLQ